MKTLILVVVLGGALAFTLVWAISGFDGSNISAHGWMALALGTVFSLALAGGLMALVFHSARRGYDDQPPSDPPE
jgi:NADH:ubiquinone oxidoreductase subunit 6 (subunit J)